METSDKVVSNAPRSVRSCFRTFGPNVPIDLNVVLNNSGAKPFDLQKVQLFYIVPKYLINLPSFRNAEIYGVLLEIA